LGQLFGTTTRHNKGGEVIINFMVSEKRAFPIEDTKGNGGVRSHGIMLGKA